MKESSIFSFFLFIPDRLYYYTRDNRSILEAVCVYAAILVKAHFRPPVWRPLRQGEATPAQTHTCKVCTPWSLTPPSFSCAPAAVILSNPLCITDQALNFYPAYIKRCFLEEVWIHFVTNSSQDILHFLPLELLNNDQLSSLLYTSSSLSKSYISALHIWIIWV